MQVEDRLSGPCAGVHNHPVVLKPGLTGGVGDEGQHATGFVGGERAHIAEGIDMSLREDEEVHIGLRVDVANRHEPVALRNVLAFARKHAKEAPIKLNWQESPPL